MALLLTVLQAAALVVLQHTVLAAEVTGAEAAVADYPLCGVLAVLECTADLFGWHAAAQWQGEGKGGVWQDVESREGGVGGARVCKMLAGVGETERCRRERCA